MSEVVPSTLAHSEALKLIRELKQDFDEEAVDFEELIEQLSQILASFQHELGSPRLEYEPVAETEPPSSRKTNRAWQRIEDDFNILKQQADMVRASTLLTHNVLATEVQESRNQTSRVENKVKTLQLFSIDDSPGVLSFSDTFNDVNQIDVESIPKENRPGLLSRGNLTLGMAGEAVNLAPEADIAIGEEWSNGFLGNNQTIEPLENHPKNPVNDNPHYEFKAQNRDYRDFEHITDREPDTWIEYESYYIPERDRPVGVTFTYRATGEDGVSESIDWAQRPPNGVLRLQLNFDLQEKRTLNQIEFTPKSFGEKDYPVFVQEIAVSSDGTTWDRVGGDKWVGNEPSLRTARSAEDVTVGSAVWGFESRSVRYVRIRVRQDNAMKTKTGYIYWVDPNNESQIVEGPEPDIEEPEAILGHTFRDGALQQRGVIDANRWAIGISGLSLMKRTYKAFASMVSQPLRIGGIVDRVILEDVEMTIPESYPAGDLWIRFYISPDNGDSWHAIAPIQDDFHNIPQQIAYNDPTPEAFREPGVRYHDVDDTVEMLRFKAELTRPSGFTGTSPILHSYSLKVLRRE